MNRFETERLILRDWTPDDAEQAFAIYGDPEVMRYLGGGGKPQESVETQRASLEKAALRYREQGLTDRGFGFWASVEKATGRIVGAILLKPLPAEEGRLTNDIEIGWHLGRFAWGHGFATEGALAVMDYAFRELRLPQIYSVVFPENVPSIRVTERLGMTPRGMTDRYYDGLNVALFEKRG